MPTGPGISILATGNPGGNGPPVLGFPMQSLFVTKLPPGATSYTPMPNLRPVAIQEREYEPGTARFRYSFDQRYASPPYNFPQRIEQVYPYSATGPYVVNADDRLQVLMLNADGSYTVLCDGYAVAPQADLDAEKESATIECVGSPVREWDKPLTGAVYRDADKSTTPGGDPTVDPPTGFDFQTNLPIRFNPDGLPNATLATYDSGTGTKLYPVFLDERVIRSPDIRRHWTLGMAVRYVIWTGNWAQTNTRIGAMANLDQLLQAVVPTSPGGTINFNNPSSFTYKDIVVPDIDVSGYTWPEALRRLIEPHGFAFRWQLDTDNNNLPVWVLWIYRKDDNLRIKSVKIQTAGSNLDPTQSDAGSISLQRDGAGIINHFITQTHPRLYEASFVLAPGFDVSAADLSNLDSFRKGEAGQDKTLSTKYRLFVFDETGDGHWDFSSGSKVTTVASLDKVLVPEAPATSRQYAHRRRPPRSTLITTDSSGEPLQAQLWVSTDYLADNTLTTAGIPGVWQPATTSRSNAAGGTWQRVTRGGWKLCDDRIGIELTMPDPTDWSIGAAPMNQMTTAPFPSGKVNIVQGLAGPDTWDPTAINPLVYFRLTCVIEDDRDLDAEGIKRLSSPTNFDIARHDDVRDRFGKTIISSRSHLNPDNTTDRVVRDDTNDAIDHADGRRRAHEHADFAGTIGFNFLNLANLVGDKIDQVQGRGISLASTLAASQGESAFLPSIVGRDHDFGDSHQRTNIHMSDRRVEPQHAQPMKEAKPIRQTIGVDVKTPAANGQQIMTA